MAEVKARRTRVKKDVDLSEVVEEQIEQSIQNGDFMDRTWKPMMGIGYLIINIFDFVIGPVIYNVLQYLNPGQNIDAYQSVTLQGGGMMHLAFGAILGVTAFKK